MREATIPVLEPADAAAAAALVREGAPPGGLLPCGRRSRLARHLPGAAPGAFLSLARLDRILELDPAEQLCVVEAGMAPADLEEALAPHGLELAALAPGPRSGTLGGLLLAPDHSLLEAAWGPPRDQVLGGEWLLADGTRVRTGGRVVKNVAGYDVTRLFLGSRGRLAACLALTLRLRPRPRRPRWYRLAPGAVGRWLDPDPRRRPPARLLFRVPARDGAPPQDWLQVDGVTPPGEAILAPAASEEGAAAVAACLAAFADAPARCRLAAAGRRPLAAAAPPELAVDWLASVAACPATDLVPAAGPARALPPPAASPWLASLQQACAPGVPPFGPGGMGGQP